MDFKLDRIGMIMEPDRGHPNEAEGVLNPAAVRGKDGQLYLFPRLDPDVFKIKDDRRMVLDLLRREKIMVVQGTGFNWPEPDHFRVVTLPSVTDLRDAVGRIARFLDGYGQH